MATASAIASIPTASTVPPAPSIPPAQPVPPAPPVPLRDADRNTLGYIAVNGFIALDRIRPDVAERLLAHGQIRFDQFSHCYTRA